MEDPASPSSSSALPSHVDLNKLAVLTTLYSLVEGFITYPFDLVKTRQQVAPRGSPATVLSTTQYVHALIREGGPRSLYRGFGWNVFGGVPSEVAYYATYTHAKDLMLQTHNGRQNPGLVFFGAGLLSDAISVLLWVPADIVSQRLQLAPNRASDCARGVGAGSSSGSHGGSGDGGGGGSGSGGGGSSRGGGACSGNSSGGSARSRLACGPVAADAAAVKAAGGAETSGLEVVSGIVRREGVLGLWRGTGITMATLAPSSAVWWLTHEEAKASLAARCRCSEEHVAVLAASGSLAAVTSTIASMPLDVVKTQLQCSEASQPAADVLRGVLREMGWRGLWTGFIPRVLAAVPRSVCTVLAYERAIALCRT